MRPALRIQSAARRIDPPQTPGVQSPPERQDAMLQVLDKQYICPGEIHPISRAVHLSRLAAFYPACRECPFRTDVGQLPKQAVQRLQQTERRVERKSLFTREGVRGVWLNELNR